MDVDSSIIDVVRERLNKPWTLEEIESGRLVHQYNYLQQEPFDRATALCKMLEVAGWDVRRDDDSLDGFVYVTPPIHWLGDILKPTKDIELA